MPGWLYPLANPLHTNSLRDAGHCSPWLDPEVFRAVFLADRRLKCNWQITFPQAATAAELPKQFRSGAEQLRLGGGLSNGLEFTE
jgi:hypothetical protein